MDGISPQGFNSVAVGDIFQQCSERLRRGKLQLGGVAAEALPQIRRRSTRSSSQVRGRPDGNGRAAQVITGGVMVQSDESGGQQLVVEFPVGYESRLLQAIGTPGVGEQNADAEGSLVIHSPASIVAASSQVSSLTPGPARPFPVVPRRRRRAAGGDKAVEGVVLTLAADLGPSEIDDRIPMPAMPAAGKTKA